MSGDRVDRLSGVLLGTAVGDALGLPREGLTAARARALFGDDVRPALLLGRALPSDDTEHTCMVAQALLAARGDPERFGRSLASRLRFWLLGLPAGVGLGTARALVRAWIGFGWRTSGVPSAGNGPAMRAAVIGACLAGEPDALAAWVRVATRITHTDERAFRAAYLVALAAAYAASRAPADVDGLQFLLDARAALVRVEGLDDELRRAFELVEAHLRRGASVSELRLALGLERGVSGYAYHSVPVALYGWLRHPADFRTAVAEVIRQGGDADTTGAIVGGIAGAGVGAAALPQDWTDGVVDVPRSLAWMRRLAARLAQRFPASGAPDLDVSPLPLAWPLLLPRNLVFLIVVLAHGFRRLLPPYAWPDAPEAMSGEGVST